MNLLTEQQALDRQLTLPHGGLLTGLAPETIDDLQSRGAFAEYHAEVIVHAGHEIDYIICIIEGEVRISRVDNDYAHTPLSSLSPGQWFGESSVFLSVPSSEEALAPANAIVWTIPPDALKTFIIEEPGAVQLLFNIGTVLAQKLAVVADPNAPTTTQN